MRPGYHYYNGYWFPAAAFVAGVAAATVAPPPRPAARLAATHVRWCSERYVSYRAWDSSYQPYDGPRQQCWSPYS
ncbi:BA14K family protein [Mesorhizobium sp. M1C.F.Ca.ET.187.01.1.1]|uniref:BA14K family protein n=1 Tax=unclassified Mesorhizobium TaxID=325217 RepID=UPI0026A4F44A